MRREIFRMSRGDAVALLPSYFADPESASLPPRPFSSTQMALVR